MKAANVVSLKDMKRINQAIFLHIIFRKREVSRAELAIFTRLRPAAVSILTKELLDMEMVVETREGKAARSRETGRLQINPYGGYIGAVNVTTETITYTLFNMQLEKIAEITVENTKEIILQQLFEDVVSHIDILLDKGREAREKLIGIAISIPREFDHLAQKVLFDTGVPADGMKLDVALGFKYGKPVVIEPVIHSRAIAEYYLGAAKNVEEFIFMDISEEFEIAVVQKGKVIKMPLWFNNDLKHMAIKRDGPKCSCGKRGCLKVLLTTKAIIEQVKRIVAEKKATLAYLRSGGDSNKITLDMINRCANEGDLFIQNIITEMAEALCSGIHNIMTLINVPNIVIAGKVGQIHLFFRALSEAWANYTTFRNKRAHIHITFLQQDEANLGNGAIVLGSYFENYFIKDQSMLYEYVQRRYNYK